MDYTLNSVPYENSARRMYNSICLTICTTLWFLFVGEFGDVCRGIWYKPSSKHLSVAIKTLKVQ